MMSQASPVADGRPPFAQTGSASPELNRPGTAYAKGRSRSIQYHSPKDAMGSPYTPMTNTPPTTYANGASNGVDYMHHETNYMHMAQRPQHHSPSDPRRPSIQTNVGHYGVLSPISTQPGYHSQPHNTPQSANPMAYVPPQNFPPFSLPPSDFNTSSAGAVTRDDQQTYAPSTSGEYTDQQPQATGEMMLLDQMGMQQTMPVFGSDNILNKSPYVAIPEDFVAYLFNTHGEGSPMTGVPMQNYK